MLIEAAARLGKEDAVQVRWDRHGGSKLGNLTSYIAIKNTVLVILFAYILTYGILLVYIHFDYKVRIYITDYSIY